MTGELPFMPEPTDKEIASDAAATAFSDSIKKATTQFYDCIISAAGDAQEEAGCKSRYESALNTFKNARQTSSYVVSEVFPQ
jgi:hypothetical protein